MDRRLDDGWLDGRMDGWIDAFLFQLSEYCVS